MRVFFINSIQMCPRPRQLIRPNPLILRGDPTLFLPTPNGSRKNGGVWYMKNRAPPLFMRV